MPSTAFPAVPFQARYLQTLPISITRRPARMPITRACTGGVCLGLITAATLLLFGATLAQIAAVLVVTPVSFIALVLVGR